jgi:DedD protein
MFGEHSDSGTVRNLDAIQETEPHRGSSRLGALLLASLGGACIVFAAVALVRTAPSSAAPAVDPLGDLVARMKPEGDAPEKTPEAGVGRDVTFPRMLSDADRPTTALEAVRDSKGAAPFNLPTGAPTAPPSAADRLPVVPLPAQAMLEAIPRSEAPDQLTAMARRVSREESNEGAVQAGMPGGFQLQVSSFKKADEAEAFAAALRRRGHRAYVEAAEVQGRGLWHRVRIGPFKYKRSAVIYRQDFEAKERMVTFIVDLPKTTVKIKDAE